MRRRRSEHRLTMAALSPIHATSQRNESTMMKRSKEGFPTRRTREGGERLADAWAMSWRREASSLLSWGSSSARLAVVELSRAGKLGESALIVAYMIPCDPPWSQACPVIGG